MPCSTISRLKRALVTVLLSLASAYGVTTDFNRDSEDAAILVAYRRVAKKVRPDKGGTQKAVPDLAVRHGSLGRGSENSSPSRQPLAWRREACHQKRSCRRPGAWTGRAPDLFWEVVPVALDRLCCLGALSRASLNCTQLV